jgi:hypothetical protein
MIGKELLMIGGKSRVSVSNLKKAGKVMNADHHDRTSKSIGLMTLHSTPCMHILHF